MPSSKELRRRIKSVKNTSQITKAMQMVSATKMRRAQNQAIGSRPYWQTLLQALVSVSDRVDSSPHSLLAGNDSQNSGALVFSTDKGLCGSLNSNVFKMVMSAEFVVRCEEKESIFYTIGKKGKEFVVRSGKTLEADFPNPEKVDFNAAVKIRKFIIPEYLSGKIGKVFLVYPRFLSTLRQEARVAQLLPVEKESLLELIQSFCQEPTTHNQQPTSELLFEPNPDQVLDYALIHLIDTRIYQALLETKASEHSARMVAMKNATDNAKELVSDLTLNYNQLRQDAITRELLEATSAGAAME